jgi:hypothetical protein
MFNKIQFSDIKNTSDRDFKDISTEKCRIYTYPGYVGAIKEDGIDSLINTIDIIIQHPIGLHVSKSGHYIIDAKGSTHFMPNGFIHLLWKANPNIVC